MSPDPMSSEHATMACAGSWFLHCLHCSCCGLSGSGWPDSRSDAPIRTKKHNRGLWTARLIVTVNLRGLAVANQLRYGSRGRHAPFKVDRGRESDFNQYIAVFDLQRIHGDLHVGILVGDAGRWVVGPAVPGAYYFPTFDHSLPQRAAAMQADVVHGGVGAVYVGYADGFRAARKFFGFVGGREVGLAGELRKSRHMNRTCLAALGWTAEAAVPTFQILLMADSYFGCSVCAIITWRLKFSSIFGSRRTSVGFFASVMVSILSCSLSRA